MEKDSQLEHEQYYGKGGRLNNGASESLINSAYAHDCDDFPYLINGLHQANIAYALALEDAEVIPKNKIKNILNGLINLKNRSLSEFKIDPSFGDVYNNYDKELGALIGKDSGWLHAGRPRREAINIAFLIEIRTQILDFLNVAIDFVEVVLRKAMKERETFMPDFTYLHHAHPTTLGHYLTTFACASLRDLERFREAFGRINQSPGGSGSVNGSRLPIDRNLIKVLLGFESLTEHSRDAMWKPDLPLEVIYLLNSFMLNWSRLAEELIIWNTSEFKFIELPDELCRASVIMPQKKNPYLLTYFRGLTTSLTGKISTYAVYGKTASGFPDSRIFIYGDLPASLIKCTKALIGFKDVIEKAEFNSNRMEETLRTGFAYVTDIADELVLRERIDYKTAHQVVGKMVSEMLALNRSGNEIRLKDLQNSFMSLIGKELKWTLVFFESLIKHQNIVLSRKTIGGAGKKPLNDIFSILEKEINTNRKWCSAKEKHINKSKENLISKIKKKI